MHSGEQLFSPRTKPEISFTSRKREKTQGNEANDRPENETFVGLQRNFDKGQQSHFDRNHTSNSVPVTRTADNKHAHSSKNDRNYKQRRKNTAKSTM